MIVVSDTSVITALIQIGRIEWLSTIFGAVVIPEAVADELAVSHVDLPAWISVTAVHDKAAVAEEARKLDAGESEAIVLAVELGADFLLIDEKLGRATCGFGSDWRARRGDRREADGALFHRRADHPGSAGNRILQDFSRTRNKGAARCRRSLREDHRTPGTDISRV